MFKVARYIKAIRRIAVELSMLDKSASQWNVFIQGSKGVLRKSMLKQGVNRLKVTDFQDSQSAV